MEGKWYKLDNAAKIYPAIREKNWAPMFRIDAVLKEEVNPEVLQAALTMTYKRFPTFSVNIVKGLFWYYFEPNESEPKVRLEDTYPTSPFSEKKDGGYLFRVLHYKHRISLEIFHSITDGFGATIFLRTLLFNYFTLLNGREPIDNAFELENYGILYHKDLPTPEETADSFQYYALANNEMSLKENSAFKIPGTRIKENTLKALHVLVDVKDLHRLSKEFDATITEFLTALFIYAILDAKVYNSTEKKPIKISVPINLRKRFPSKTLRNFSSYINVEFTPEGSAERIKLKDICEVVSKQIRDGVDIDTLRGKFSGNVQTEKNIAMRIAPLMLKNIVLKTGFSLFGERITTSTLSNVGNIELPKAMADMVERFDFLIGAPKQNAFNCAVISFKDTISISFSSIIGENTVPKKFVDFLVGKGLKVNIEANY
ncbi:hypothetical protein NBE98_02445 [Clostridium swellfunianum]|uniref:hypothetical protein n=1 Tax=Clostridium swellfunianum TaxID=1367462 RepID=UPI00202EA9B0|nr:hypothetical protein [Clostridium swellfunianum]MCM0647233.1 hypothetical protein [Clostridium swellfunianum]